MKITFTASNYQRYVFFSTLCMKLKIRIRKTIGLISSWFRYLKNIDVVSLFKVPSAISHILPVVAHFIFVQVFGIYSYIPIPNKYFEWYFLARLALMVCHYFLPFAFSNTFFGNWTRNLDNSSTNPMIKFKQSTHTKDYCFLSNKIIWRNV